MTEKVKRKDARGDRHAPETATILARIVAARDQLSRMELRVADYVLEQPNGVLNMSITALAEAIGASEPTVARFCHALGFSGFKEFKLVLAKSLAIGVPYVHHDVGP